MPKVTSPGQEAHTPQLGLNGKLLPLIVWTFTHVPRRHGKDAGIIGQASWISSVINLVNTSMNLKDCD